VARLARYERSWWRGDLAAGLTVGALLITQCMAYAPLAGLPPAAAFHAAIVGIPIYALLGSSRHLAIGPDPGTALLAATGLASVAAVGTGEYLAAAAALGVLVGVVLVVAGLLRFGFVADLLSKPALVGYLTGLGVTLLIGQLGKLTGIPVTADDVFGRIADVVTGIGEASVITAVMGVGTLVLILVMKRLVPTVPAALIGVVLALVITWVFGLEDHGITVVGSIDADLPSFAWPSIPAADWAALVPTALGVALVGYADSILTARGVAAKHGDALDADAELRGLGVANVVAGFSRGMPLSSTGSGTAALSSAGGRTSLAGVIAATFVAVGLVAFPGVLERIPQPALAAVVAAAAIGLIDRAGFLDVWRVSRAETGLAAATLASVVLFDVLVGVLVSVVLGVVIALSRIARPHDAVLGNAEDLDGWVDLDAHPGSVTLPGLLVYRFDAPLFFANAGRYVARVRQVLEENPGEERWVVLDFEGVGSVDSTALDALRDLTTALTALGVQVIAVTRANEVVVDRLGRAALLVPTGLIVEYPTINAAVRAFRASTP
jgi:high affinity sulfate transporter 1